MTEKSLIDFQVTAPKHFAALRCETCSLSPAGSSAHGKLQEDGMSSELHLPTILAPPAQIQQSVQGTVVKY